nr:RNA-directed DNA polymerase, eukaryota [Tanacetum cinerariifolium]
MFRMALKLKILKGLICGWVKGKKDKALVLKKELKNKLSDIDSSIDKGKTSSTILEERMAIMNNFSSFEKMESIELAQKAKLDTQDSSFSNVLPLCSGDIVINRWKGDVIVMDDFNEVRSEDERYGSIFNARGAAAFNSFISAGGLMEVPAGVHMSLPPPSLPPLSLSSTVSTINYTHHRCKSPTRPIIVTNHQPQPPPMHLMPKLISSFRPASKEKGGLGVSSFFALNRALIFKWVWRFRSQSNSQWSRVIKALHGEDGENGSPTSEFQFFKGLKQGDPLSSFLFILVRESLHLSFQNVVDAGLFKGQWCESNIATIIRVLDCFYRASGLHINLHKSKILGLGVENDLVKLAANSIGCIALFLPFLYLGVNIGGHMSQISSWEVVIDNVRKRLSKWKMKVLSVRGDYNIKFAITTFANGLDAIPMALAENIGLSTIERLSAMNAYQIKENATSVLMWLQKLLQTHNT